MQISNYLKQCQKNINARLKKLLPSTNSKPHELFLAMDYATFGNAKRVRAAFTYATGQAFGAKMSVLHDVASAMEMIHAYTLIQDDLPDFDNADLRRGRPTCYKVYGVATSILASDGLLTLAFETIANINGKYLKSDCAIEMIKYLAKAIGAKGMIAGEQIDLDMVNQKASAKEIEHLHKLKTGCLLRSSIVLGMLASNCNNKKILNHLSKFAENLGLAFQIHDDIIGIESDTKTLGKDQSADIVSNKPVYPVITSMEIAKKRELTLYKNAINHLEKIEKLTRNRVNLEKLKALSAYTIERKN